MTNYPTEAQLEASKHWGSCSDEEYEFDCTRCGDPVGDGSLMHVLESGSLKWEDWLAAEAEHPFSSWAPIGHECATEEELQLDERLGAYHDGDDVSDGSNPFWIGSFYIREK